MDGKQSMGPQRYSMTFAIPMIYHVSYSWSPVISHFSKHVKRKQYDHRLGMIRGFLSSRHSSHHLKFERVFFAMMAFYENYNCL